MASAATVQLAPGVPFVSDADLDHALEQAGVPPDTAAALVDLNTTARVEALQVSLAVLAILAAVAIFLTRLLPPAPAGRRKPDAVTD